jgi:hypothetical protein
VKYIAGAIAFFLFSINSVAGKHVDIASCENNYVITGTSNHLTLRSRKDTTRSELTLTHEVEGGIIDSQGKFFAVYGLPNNIDKTFPQSTVISVFRDFKRPKLEFRRRFGYGIFGVSFSKDRAFLIIDERNGTIIFNLLTHKFTAVDDDGPTKQTCD